MNGTRLVVEKGRSKGRTVPIAEDGPTVAGREASNALQVVDPQASRKHFQVAWEGEAFVLTDLGSSNGTFVNGERVERCVLEPGDKIALGETLVYFLAGFESEDGEERSGALTGEELGGYRVGRLLGRGGMGTVYEALQVSLDRTVAFKVLAPELTHDAERVERFVAEARAAGRLNHANIVSVFDVGCVDGVHYYSMEYMPGGSLDDLLRAEGPLPVARTIPMMFDAARGLEYAERHSLVHRDIKPDNLMLGPDETVKICDLGLAIFQSRQHDVSGSPHYIAPEQALGKDVDARADLYALGVSWYELLSGQTPFTGRSAQEIARKHVTEEPPPLRERAPEVPEDVAELVARLMAKDPAQRVPSARQLQADLAVLARRHTVRETAMLRIDSVAPPDAPSAELVAAAPAPVERAFPLGPVVLILAAAGVAFSTLLVARTLLARQASREADATAEVAELQQQLEAGDLAWVVTRAGELQEDLAARGFDEQAAAAAAWGAEARRREQEQELERRTDEANQKLDDARSLFENPGSEGDARALAELTEVERRLGALIEEYADTDAAPRAQALRSRVSAKIRALREAADRFAERQADARRALTLARRRITDLLGGSASGRFAQALTVARDYAGEFGDVEPRGGEALEADVHQAAAEEVRRRTARALQHAGVEQWAEAAAELEAVAPPLGFADLEERVRACGEAVAAAQHQARLEVDRREQRADERRLRESLGALAPTLQALRFGDAASSLRGDALLLKGEAIRASAETRVARLEGADRALEALAEHVRAGGAGVELEVEVTGMGRRKASAVRVDRRGRRFTFAVNDRVSRDVDLEDLTPQELLGLVEAVPLDPAGRVDAACLAFELQLVGDAERLLARGAALDPAQADRAAALRELAARGQAR